MNPTLLYRVASGLLVFFGVTHTIGLLSDSDNGVALGAVVGAMKSVRFETMGTERVLWDFYLGFGLLLTVYLLGSAVWSWTLGSVVRQSPGAVRALAWPFALCHVAVAVLCWTNFFIAPALTATLIAGCLVA